MQFPEDGSQVPDARRPDRRAWKVLWGLILMVAIAACIWAVAAVLHSNAPPVEGSRYTYVRVAEGEVSAPVALNVNVEWGLFEDGVNQAAGVVTTVDLQPGGEVVQGSVLFTVGLRPVVAAKGDVPMFRSIGHGASGEDVAQLQAMLADVGVYSGSIDGVLGASTVESIKLWQSDLGEYPTGVVELGDVIFLQSLPSRALLNTDVISRGNTLDGGELAVSRLSEAPEFWIPLLEGQLSLVFEGTPVEVSGPNGEVWSGTTGLQQRDQDSSAVAIQVLGVGGAAPCGDACTVIPAHGQTTLPIQVITVPRVTGLVVPSTALVSTDEGKLSVIDADGRFVPVNLIASAKGMSIVEGPEAGVSVRVPARLEDAK